MFTKNDVADYYDQTEVHYRRFWKLSKRYGIHYGIWENQTTNFGEALDNTNRILAELAEMRSDDIVLDAGCGIGGSAIYLARNYGCRVTGISLSRKQISKARSITEDHSLDHLLTFAVKDYSDTGYSSGNFDIIWALESIGTTQDKGKFLAEAFRLLKPGGRIILADYFKTTDHPVADQPILHSWLKLWAISDLETEDRFRLMLRENGFVRLQIRDYTRGILPSARRMYFSSLLGAPTSILYNLFHKKVSRFAKHHYKSGILQYKALRKGLWEYKVLMACKPGMDDWETQGRRD